MSRHTHHAVAALIGVALMSSTAAAQDRPADPDSATLIVVGCVRANPDEAGPAQNFVLADASADFSSGLKPGPRTEPTKRYALIGGEMDLSKLEGQRVKINGRIVPSTKPEEQAVGTAGSEQARPETQRLKITAVEVVPGTCSPQ